MVFKPFRRPYETWGWHWGLPLRLPRGLVFFPPGDLTYGTLQGHFDDVREVGAGHGMCRGSVAFSHVWEATLFN